MLKKLLRVSLVLTVLALSLSFYGLTRGVEQANAAEVTTIGTISVSGQGEMMVTPDVAYVQVGLETSGTTAKEAQDANAKQFANLSKALKELKIVDKDIKTTSFSTYPNYEWIKDKQELKGYLSHLLNTCSFFLSIWLLFYLALHLFNI